MKNKSILLMSVLSMSMTAYSMNLSWLGKLKPVVSRVASAACNYVKGHKVVSGAVVVAAVFALYANKMYKKHVLGPKKLWDAIRTGNEHEVRALLQAGIDPNIDYNDEPLLHAAVRAGNVAIVQLLCEYGANIEAVDSFGSTSLHRAVVGGNAEIVSILVQAGANKEAVDGCRRTPLHCAVERGNTEIVRTLVRAGANKDAINRNGDTPLHLAVNKGDPEIVRILMQAGANKDAVNRNGDTPLHQAVIGGNAEIIRILVQAGANTEALDSHGFTALHRAAYDKDKIEIVRTLVQADVNKEALDSLGDTALHWAVKRGNTEVVSILVQAGANIEAVDSLGYTPLRRAAREGYTEIVCILVQACANIVAVDGNGYTALHYAVERGNAEIVRILVQAGANTVAVDGNGRTLRALAQAEHRHKIIGYLDSLPQKEEQMHAAAQAGNVGKVQELVAQGAPVWPGIVAAIGEYNLQAPSREHCEIARLLLETMGMRQAARAKCADGRTLLHVAAACGNTKFAEALARYGADVNAVDVIGNTPLHLAKTDEMNACLLRHGGAGLDGSGFAVENKAREIPFLTQINQWMPWFRKWVEEDQKIPDMFMLKSDSAS